MEHLFFKFSIFDNLFLNLTVIFGVVHFLTLVSPGPALALVFRNSLGANSSRTRTLACAAGLSAPVLIYSLACMFGLGPLMATSPTLKLILQISGGLFIAGLGIMGLMKHTLQSSVTETAQPSRGKAFVEGFFANILSPYVLAPVIAIFTTANDEDVLATMFMQGVWTVEITLLTFLWYGAVGLCLTSRRAQNWLASKAVIIDWFSNLVLIGLGGLLLYDALEMHVLN